MPRCGPYAHRSGYQPLKFSGNGIVPEGMDDHLGGGGSPWISRSREFHRFRWPEGVHGEYRRRFHGTGRGSREHAGLRQRADVPGEIHRFPPAVHRPCGNGGHPRGQIDGVRDRGKIGIAGPCSNEAVLKAGNSSAVKLSAQEEEGMGGKVHSCGNRGR